MEPSTEEVAATQRVAANATPEEIQGVLAEKMGVSPQIAREIVPDENAKQELFDFMKKEGIPLTKPEGMQNPQVLARFIQTKPDTMLRVVQALPAGGMAALPAPLKEALKATLGDRQILAGMVATDSPHKAWIAAAIAQVGKGIPNFDAAAQTKLLELAGTNSGAVAQLLSTLIDNSADTAAIDALGNLVWENSTPTEKSEMTANAYEEFKKSNDNYKSLLEALETADSSFKAEAVAALTKNPNKTKLAETLLPIIIANPDRINALKSALDANPALTQKLVTEFLSTNNLQDNVALKALLSDGILCGKTINFILDNKEHTADLIAAFSGKPAALLQKLATNDTLKTNLTTYVTGVKTTVSGWGSNAPGKTEILAQITAIEAVITQPENTAAALDAVAKLPASTAALIKTNIPEGSLAAPVAGALGLMFNDGFRHGLLGAAHDANNRAHYNVIADTLKDNTDVKALIPEPLQALLTKQNENGEYVNLQALLAAADAMDKATGANDTTLAGALAKSEAERSEADNALLRTLLESEQAADAANIKYLSILMALGQTDGIKLVQNQAESVAAGDKKYRLTSNPDVTFSASEVAGYFANDKDGKPNANIVAFAQLAKTLKENNPNDPVLSALAEHFWNDKNDNKKVDTNEGFASVLFNAGNLQTVLAMPANGGKQTPFDAVLTSLAKGLVLFDNPPLLSLMAFKEVVDQPLAPVPTPATGSAPAR